MVLGALGFAWVDFPSLNGIETGTECLMFCGNTGWLGADCGGMVAPAFMGFTGLCGGGGPPVLGTK